LNISLLRVVVVVVGVNSTGFRPEVAVQADLELAPALR
jgi:hypothetical protein